jgi:hypothetical protein
MAKVFAKALGRRVRLPAGVTESRTRQRQTTEFSVQATLSSFPKRTLHPSRPFWEVCFIIPASSISVLAFSQEHEPLVSNPLHWRQRAPQKVSLEPTQRHNRANQGTGTCIGLKSEDKGGGLALGIDDQKALGAHE